jgi:hypothetical protein
MTDLSKHHSLIDAGWLDTQPVTVKNKCVEMNGSGTEKTFGIGV